MKQWYLRLKRALLNMACDFVYEDTSNSVSRSQPASQLGREMVFLWEQVKLGESKQPAKSLGWRGGYFNALWPCQITRSPCPARESRFVSEENLLDVTRVSHLSRYPQSLKVTSPKLTDSTTKLIIFKERGMRPKWWATKWLAVTDIEITFHVKAFYPVRLMHITV